MTSELATSEGFQERMRSKIRESIGELLTEQEIKTMVDRSLEELFFSKQRDHFGRENGPPLLHDLVGRHAEPIIKVAVRDYVYENAGVILELLKPTLEQGFGEIVMAGLKTVFRNTLDNMGFDMVQKVRDSLSGF